MKDINGKDVQVGNNIILTVSRKSHYLTSATVESIDEDSGTLVVRYSSTITTKKIHDTDPFFVYTPVPYRLNGELGLCRDCVNQVIEPGQMVAYRISGGIAFGKIIEVKDSLWAKLENGQEVRNVGIFVL